MLIFPTDLGGFTLMKRGHECGSSEEWLDYVSSADECANKCRYNARCKYFIVGNYGSSLKCYWEKTSSHNCSEGWKADSYDFYELHGKYWVARKYFFITVYNYIAKKFT